MELKMKDRWLSVDEIAAYLRIKRDTIYKWIAETEVPKGREL
ncbi:helix-turn-helix transcriptional regulator [Dissulfuribacter thermophilus]|nr:excisionase family DNA-binding protein [Dissulfuribacter thermophilus]